MTIQLNIFFGGFQLKKISYFYRVMNQDKKDTKKDIFIKWIRRIGIWGFLFFLVKGLIWLALGYWVLK